MQLKFITVLCLLVGVGCLDVIVPKSPPEPYQAALMARYIIHNTGWVSLATISVQDAIKGYPFVSLKSMSDGPKNKSTGKTYLYMTQIDVSGTDIETDNRITIMASLAETDYCETENFDPQDPRCAKVMITGSLKKLKKDSAEYKFGENALFDKHPAMKSWPQDHEFYVALVDIKTILVLDYFGGIKHVTIDDYYNANLTNIINQDFKFPGVSVLDIIY